MTIPEALNLALQRQHSGDVRGAEQLYRQILAQQPKCAEAWHRLALLAARAGNRLLSVEFFGNAVALEPNRPDYRVNFGAALATLDRLDDALVQFETAAQLNTGWASAHNNVGVIYRRKGQLDQAIAWYGQAVTLQPDYADALNNLGEAVSAKGEYDKALLVCRRALELRPGYFEAALNIADALGRKGEYEQAAAAYQAALALRPDDPTARGNLGTILLLQGDFERGWREFDARWSRRRQAGALKLNGPAWDGCDLDGRRILLYAEQEIADVIQFARYVPNVIERGGKVVLAVPRELRRLLENSTPHAEWADPNEPAPRHDAHCALTSLPMVFKTTLQNIPSQAPYLAADAALGAQWRERLAGERRRKVGLAALSALEEFPGIRFFTLQREEAEPMHSTAGLLQITAWTDPLGNLDETAALIDNLDLIVTTDTSAAHLAGALGKPVWVLLPFVPDWRWMLNRADSPWYPTMRLFRQPSPGDWNTPIEQVLEALHSL